MNTYHKYRIKLIFLIAFFQLLSSLFVNSNPLKTVSVSQHLQIIVFFSPTCPICQYYTSELNKIQDSLNINIKAFIPKKCIANQDEINSFKEKYNPHFQLFYDKRNKHVKKWKPTITPEFYIIQGDKILYQGAFDDRFIDIGKKNATVKHHFLYNALQSITAKTEYIRKTQAVGCIIVK